MLRRLLLTADTVGGVWRYALELAHGLAACGVRILLVTLGPRPGDAQRAEAAAVPGLRLTCTDLPLDWLATEPAQLADAAEHLARLARRSRIDAVHLHTPALVGEASWPGPVAAVAHSCVGTWWRAVRGGEMPPDLAWRADAVARGIAAADVVIAPSHSFAAELIRQYGGMRPIHTVYNGRRDLGLGARRAACVFTAGRLWDPGKNAATLDAAAQRLDVPVLAAGPIAAPNGGAVTFPHLRLLGHLDAAAIAQQFASARVFVSVALYEPFGLAVLEAAQAGCALVLSDIPTFRELWDCAAVFVDPHDADRLAEVLRTLVRSPARCAHLGELARQRAAAFSVARMADATCRVHADAQQQQRVAA